MKDGMYTRVIKLAFVATITLLLAMPCPSAFAGLPSAKATAKVGAINILDSAGLDWTTILSQEIKTPLGKDLFIDVSLEVGLYTQTLVASKNGNKDKSVAEAGVKVRVLVDGEEALPGVVVFGRRSQTLEAEFAGLIDGCLSLDDLGNVILDEDCVATETLNLILDTMNANSFNFVMPDLSAAVHTVEVQAMVQTDSSSQNGSASALGSIGKGSVTVETVRMIKNEDVELE